MQEPKLDSVQKYYPKTYSIISELILKRDEEELNVETFMKVVTYFLEKTELFGKNIGFYSILPLKTIEPKTRRRI